MVDFCIRNAPIDKVYFFKKIIIKNHFETLFNSILAYVMSMYCNVNIFIGLNPILS